MLIDEEPRQIEVRDEVDVLVAGGGVSGCAAAVAAGRTGARTVLIERNGALGGVATSGLMANIGNLVLDRDGNAVVGGIAREVLERMGERGAAGIRRRSRSEWTWSRDLASSSATGSSEAFSSSRMAAARNGISSRRRSSEGSSCAIGVSSGGLTLRASTA